MAKINISMPDEVLAKVEANSKKLGLSRSAYITMMVSQGFMQAEAMEMLPRLLQAVEMEARQKQP